MTTRPVRPDKEDFVREWIAHYLENLDSATVGRVVRYDAAQQTADVAPSVRHAVLQPDGTTAYEDLPVIPSVPLIFPRSGDWFLSIPVASGDFVLLVTLDLAYGHWWAGNGDNQYPGDLRRHHITNAVAIPGLFPKPRAMNHAGPGDLVLGRRDGATIRIDGDNVVHAGLQASETSAADFVALAAKVDALADTIKNAFNAHVHTVPGAGVSGGPQVIPSGGGTPTPGGIGPLESVAATKLKAT